MKGHFQVKPDKKLGFKVFFSFFVVLGLIINFGCASTPSRSLSSNKGGLSSFPEEKEISFSYYQPGLLEEKKNSVFTEVAGFSEYLVGPGDVLFISFWRGTEVKDYTVTVRSDGKISFSFIEDLSVSGLSPLQIDKLISEKLSEYIVRANIEVLVKEYHSKKVTIEGAVRNLIRQPTGPGVYTLKGKTYLLDFLSEVGGPKPEANLKRVQIIRGEKIFLVNLYQVIFEGDQSQNIVLDDKDRIVIPGEVGGGRFFVIGEVNKQGGYVFSDKISIVQAISEAGGFTTTAITDKVTVIRGDRQNPQLIPVNVDRVLKGRAEDIRLKDNDVVYVSRSFIGSWNVFISQITPTFQLLSIPLDVIVKIEYLRRD